MQRPNRDILATLGALSAAILCAKLSYTAGYSVHPGIATSCLLLKFWLPVLAAAIIAFPWNRWASGSQPPIRIALSLACLFPLFIPGFRADTGFVGFIARMKQDVKPRELAAFLATAGLTKTDDAPPVPLTPSAWALFGNRNAPYPLPTLYRWNARPMIAWGDDFRTWAISLEVGESPDIPWQNNLCFRTMQK
jgi:hypothetical protein